MDVVPNVHRACFYLIWKYRKFVRQTGRLPIFKTKRRKEMTQIIPLLVSAGALYFLTKKKEVPPSPIVPPILDELEGPNYDVIVGQNTYQRISQNGSVMALLFKLPVINNFGDPLEIGGVSNGRLLFDGSKSNTPFARGRLLIGPTRTKFEQRPEVETGGGNVPPVETASPIGNLFMVDVVTDGPSKPILVPPFGNTFVSLGSYVEYYSLTPELKAFFNQVTTTDPKQGYAGTVKWNMFKIKGDLILNGRPYPLSQVVQSALD